MSDDELPEVHELNERDSDWAFWPAPGEHLPTEIAEQCDCGHGNLGPNWHMHDCPTVLAAWKWRAKCLHDELWDLKEAQS